ncbi:MAG TPA: metallophosphoesterase family protein, partial [Planctomycetota bacterium]|nr:metallophosphoesterase family protein [Planctomycetota bacterium]
MRVPLWLCLLLLSTSLFPAEKADEKKPPEKVEAKAPLSPEPDSATLERGPYLQLATNKSIVVVWRTTGLSTPAVRYGKSPDKLDQTVPVKDITILAAPHIRQKKFKKLHSAPDWTYQYEAAIGGLETNSTYYYAVYDGETRLAGGDENFHFTTLPRPGANKSVRFWVVGDSGTGNKDQLAVIEGIQKWLSTQPRKLEMYLHVGDMAYSRGTDKEFTKGFFKPYADILRNTVCWASMGNHEGATSRGDKGTGPYYDAYVCPRKAEAGGVASGTEAYYSFDYGQVHFICLDSHDVSRKPDDAMARWLRADLEKTNAEWLIAFFHHPPYTKGSHDSDKETREKEMRTYIMPILESGGVDLVLTGHSHIYERSMLIDGAYATPTVAENVVLDDGDGDPQGDGAYRKSAGLNPNEGDVQIVTGHGGAKLRRKG